MKFHNAIVITGSIACGKSSVCEILKRENYEIISADEISHLMLEHSKQEILAIFGDQILDENQQINRKKLAKIVFSDAKSLQILEQILHPKIWREIIKKCENLENLISKNTIKSPYFVEIPLYFESKDYGDFRQILVVFSPYKLCLQRLKNRDNLTQNEAIKRINLQIPAKEKCKKATFIIENCGNFDALKDNVKNFLAHIDAKFTPKI